MLSYMFYIPFYQGTFHGIFSLKFNVANKYRYRLPFRIEYMNAYNRSLNASYIEIIILNY